MTAEPLIFWDAVQDLPQRRAMDFQRQALRGIEKMPNRFDERALTFKCGSVRLSMFDALHTALVARLGAAAAALELLAELRTRNPDRTIVIDRRPVTNDLRAALTDAELGPLVQFAPAGSRWQHIVEKQTRRAKSVVAAVRRWQEPPPRPQPVDWLVFPRMPGHLTDLIPVIRHARSTLNVNVGWASTNSRLTTRLAEAGHPLVGLDSRPGSLVQTTAAAQAEWLQRLLMNETTTSPDDSSPSPGLLRLARRILQEQGPAAIEAAYFCDWLIAECRPKLVIVGNPYTMEGRILGALARARGIPSTTIQHGTIFARDPSWEHCAGDLICTWGESSRQSVISSGIDAERVVATGAPRYDAILAQHVEPAAPSLRRTVLVAASGAGDKVTLAQHRQFIRLLYDAAGRAPELEWVVKLHRKDRRDYYPPAAATPANLTIVESDYEQDGLEIFRRLATAAVLVTVSSTAVLDAAIVGVPVVTVNVWPAGEYPTEIDFLTDGSTTSVATAEELVAAARRLATERSLASTNSAASPQTAYFANPGRACETVVAHWADLAARKLAPPQTIGAGR